MTTIIYYLLVAFYYLVHAQQIRIIIVFVLKLNKCWIWTAAKVRNGKSFFFFQKCFVRVCLALPASIGNIVLRRS